MSTYQGLYTFDVDSHKYIPVGQSDGIIDCFNFSHESKEPLIKDEKIRKAVKAMAYITGVSMLYYEYYEWSETVQLSDMNGQTLTFKSKKLPVKALESYTIAELCGEEEE